jgi:hypothetical protein
MAVDGLAQPRSRPFTYPGRSAQYGIPHSKIRGARVQPLDPQPALIDRAYEQLVEAIADGTLAPGKRIRQVELGRAWRVAAADQPRAAIAQTAEAGRGERPPRADRLRDRRRQNSRTLPGSHGARRASRAARRRAHRGSGRRHAAAPRGGRLRQAWRSVPILRCWRSSRPMSPFTPRCIACPATARSRTPSRRNGRI